MARLFARLGKKQSYRWEPVSVSPKGKLTEVLGATSYFCRYNDPIDGRTTKAAGKTLREAEQIFNECRFIEGKSPDLVPVVLSPKKQSLTSKKGRIRLPDAEELESCATRSPTQGQRANARSKREWQGVSQEK